MNRPDLIAILIPSLAGGAFTNLGITIAKSLTSLGFNVQLVTVQKPTDHQKVVIIGLEHLSLDSSRSSYALPGLMRYLRNQRPSVLIAMPTLVNFVAIIAHRLSRSRSLLILSEQANMTLDRMYVYPHKPKMRLIPAITKALYPLADGLFAPSQEGLTNPSFMSHTQRCRFPKRVIPNPLTWNFATPRIPSHPPHHWLTPDRSFPTFISIGRLSHEKGIDTILKAFRALLDQGSEARLLILGEDGPAASELRNLLNTLDLQRYVEFLGFRENARDYLASSNGLVMASRSEPFGLIFPEAMALGLPIMATNAPGGPKEFLKNGVNSLVVPIDDSLALASAIQQIIEGESFARELGDRARVDSEGFRADAVALKYVAFMQECAAYKHGAESPRHLK